MANGSRTDVVVLIGPMGAGKSTIAGLLSERLGKPRVSMDDVRWNYYNEIGYCQETAQKLGSESGFPAVYRYWKPFELHAVERLLAESCDCVIDFGGGHSVYEDDAQLARAEAALAPFAHVFLLLPSPDSARSVELLRKRGREKDGFDGIAEGFDFHEHFVTHPSNARLAKHIVYSENKTPEQTADEIAARIATP